MSEVTDKKPRKKRRNKSNSHRKQGYTNVSPAVCIVLYDLAGRPMPDKIAAEFINTAAGIAKKYGYVISSTRQ